MINISKTISHKKPKDSLEKRAEPVVLRSHVENQAKVEPILPYRASKCKQTQKQGIRTVYEPTFLPFYEIFNSLFRSRVKIRSSQDQLGT